MRSWTGVAFVAFSVMVSACASPDSPTSSTPATPTVSAAPSGAITKAMSTAFSGLTSAINGTKNGSKALRPLLSPTAILRPEYSVQCNASGSSCSIQFNESFNQSQACSGGGSSNSTATLTGVISGDATFVSGTLNLSQRSTFSDCSEGGYLTNSNPSLATNGQMFLTSQHMRLNLTMSGGFVITNAPGTAAARSSCVTNGILLQWDDITGNWANSGTIDCSPGGSFHF